LVWLFAGTLFVSAWLLFLVQPMVAKMVLPLLGGAPEVWTTCLVFFQAALLAGYAYAHLLAGRGGMRRAAVHLCLMLLALGVLPIGIRGGSAPDETAPRLWLLRVLVGGVGLPFFAVAASAPLLQGWFARTAHRSARDPYFLYGASNLGSVLALVSYPALMEPSLGLTSQARAWAAGYGILVVLIGACAFLAARSSAQRAMQPPEPKPAASVTGPIDRETLSLGTRLHWLALAFVPSSLMLGVTTYITTEVAPVPLLWVLPLGLYLFSFILAFSALPILLHRVMLILLPSAVVVLLLGSLGHISMGSRQLMGVHLATFFVAAMVCHGELALSRPRVERLTEFYLWVALGGVLGGAFNALAAPRLFDRIVEYPLAFVLVFLLPPRLGQRRSLGEVLWTFSVGKSRASASSPLARKAAVAASPLVGEEPPAPSILAGEAHSTHFPLVGEGCGGGSCESNEPAGRNWIVRAMQLGWIAFGFVIAWYMVKLLPGYNPDAVVLRERGFFGVLRVSFSESRRLIGLWHGVTIHGWQNTDPAERAVPLSYYHRDSPIGQVFAAFSGPSAKSSIAVVGLGTGTLASYAGAGQQITFYEIDPAIERLARDASYFTYLHDCEERGAKLNVVRGDARLRLAQATDRYGLICIDAFSSDAIPTHLLTREALRVYLDRLSDDGIIAFHISNRYFKLETVVANLAADAGLVGLLQNEPPLSAADRGLGKYDSKWALLARRHEDLGELTRDERWEPLQGHQGSAVWTDDYSNPLSTLVW
jgi:hypothetical protein